MITVGFEAVPLGRPQNHAKKFVVAVSVDIFEQGIPVHVQMFPVDVYYPVPRIIVSLEGGSCVNARILLSLYSRGSDCFAIQIDQYVVAHCDSVRTSMVRIGGKHCLSWNYSRMVDDGKSNVFDSTWKIIVEQDVTFVMSIIPSRAHTLSLYFPHATRDTCTLKRPLICSEDSIDHAGGENPCKKMALCNTITL